jgi:conjugative relaxase-like TrwC/TraI family protein
VFHGSRCLTVAQARQYYLQEYLRDDHARGPRAEVVGVWLGRGAESLGLKGPVQEPDFVALLEGKSGKGGSQLVQSQVGTGKHRAAWDFGCSTDKSVSIAALVGGDEAILEAYRKAVLKGFFELERFAQVDQVRHGLRRKETTGSMVAARFEHKTNRKADPHLHNHIVVMNMTQTADGCWRALVEREVFGALPLATAVHRAELARLLGELGYRVLVRPDGRVGIDGLTKEQLDHFSRRRKEVEAYLLKYGLSGPRAAERAALNTREAKARDVDPATLVASWMERARNLGIDLRGLRERCSDVRVVGAETVRAAARESVAFALAHVSQTRAVFQEREIEVVALNHGLGRIVVEDVRAAVQEQEGVIRMRDFRLPSDLLTTRQALRLEKRAIDLMRAGQDVGFALRGSFRPPRELGPDQERVVRFVLDGRDHVIGLRAREGTRKPSALSALREAAEGCGWRVGVLSPEWLATNQPPDAGFDVAVGAPGRGDSNPHPRELWIVDSADRLSSKLAVSILEKASETGAKVVLVGDPQRCHPVEVGNPFAYLRRAGLRTHGLYPSGRQQDRVLREVVARTSEGRDAEAIAALGDGGRILEIANVKDRHQAIVNEFLKAPESLVIVARNDERIELNRLIREALIAAGKVEGSGSAVPVAVSRGLTEAQKGDARSYEVGDRIRFLERWSRHGIARGSEGRVLAVDQSRNRIAVQSGDGRIFDYDPRRCRCVEVSAIEAQHFAVGDRVQLRAFRKPRAASGEFGTIRSLDPGRIHILLDRGRWTRLRRGEEPLPLTHAYAIVSPRELGKTVDRVLLSVDTSVPPELVNRELFFFSIVTARREALVFTDNQKDLAAAVGREADRSSGAHSMRRRKLRGKSRDEGHRLQLERARLDDGARAGIDADRANGGPRTGVERGDGKPRGPLPLANRQGAAAPHNAGRAREAARHAGGARQEARGPGRPQRAATASPLRTAERVSPACDGADGAGGDRRARPGGSGGRAAARASAAGYRGLEAGGGPLAEGPHGDDRAPDYASDRGPGVPALAVSRGASREPAPGSGSEPDRPRARTGKPGLPPLSGVLERVRALERLDEERALRPRPAPRVDRELERDR